MAPEYLAVHDTDSYYQAVVGRLAGLMAPQVVVAMLVAVVVAVLAVGYLAPYLEEVAENMEFAVVVVVDLFVAEHQHHFHDYVGHQVHQFAIEVMEVVAAVQPSFHELAFDFAAVVCEEAVLINLINNYLIYSNRK